MIIIINNYYADGTENIILFHISNTKSYLYTICIKVSIIHTYFIITIKIT